MLGPRLRALVGTALAGVVVAGVLSAGTTGGASAASPGGVFVNRPLPAPRLVPGAASGDIFTYGTLGADGRPRMASAMVQLPGGRPPAGGWPVVVWSHDTVGIADRCAPSNRPTPADTGEIGTWIGRGYAVISPDLVGLGTPGTPETFDTDASARAIIDAVSASRDVTPGLSPKWVVVGHAQGAPAAVELARLATRWQTVASDYRGSVAWSIPVEFASLYANLGPATKVLPRGMALDVLYTLAAIRDTRPTLAMNGYLTAAGMRWLDRAEGACADELGAQVANLPMGTLFAKPLGGNVALMNVLAAAKSIPLRGFTRPVMLAQSLLDDNVSVPLSLRYLDDAHRADSHVLPRYYLTPAPQQADFLVDNDIRQFVAGLLSR